MPTVFIGSDFTIDSVDCVAAETSRRPVVVQLLATTHCSVSLLLMRPPCHNSPCPHIASYTIYYCALYHDGVHCQGPLTPVAVFSSSCFRIVCIISTLLTGVQQSTRYCRALSCRHLCMMTPSLYVTRSATSSQCKSSCKILVRPWSNFLVSLTTHAAAFITRCSVSVTDFVAPASLALNWSTREVSNV